MAQHCTEIIGAADNPRFGFKSHLGREQYPQKCQLEKVNLDTVRSNFQTYTHIII